MKSLALAILSLTGVASAFTTRRPTAPLSGSSTHKIHQRRHLATAHQFRFTTFTSSPLAVDHIRLQAEESDDNDDGDEAGQGAVATGTTDKKEEEEKQEEKVRKPRPSTSKPGVDGPLRLSSTGRADDYVSPVNFEKGVTAGPGALISPRWSDSGRWEKEQDVRAQTGAESEGEQQFLLKEKYGTYFRVPNAATLMTSK